MRISELPKEYRNLIPEDTEIKNDDINLSFTWSATPEGHNFWATIYQANSIEELPPPPPKPKKGFKRLSHKKMDSVRTLHRCSIEYKDEKYPFHVIQKSMENCGMCLLCGFTDLSKKVVNEYKEDLLNFYKSATSYPYALATHNDKHDYLFYGWEKIDTFKNPNSGNTINVWKLDCQS